MSCKITDNQITTFTELLRVTADDPKYTSDCKWLQVITSHTTDN